MKLLKYATVLGLAISPITFITTSCAKIIKHKIALNDNTKNVTLEYNKEDNCYFITLTANENHFLDERSLVLNDKYGLVKPDRYEIRIDANNKIVIVIESNMFIGNLSIGINSLQQAKDFSADPWSTLEYYCDKGLDALKRAYPQWSTFVGMERILYINNLPYRTRVVSINHDKIADSDKKATLTFEFINLFSQNTNYNGNYRTVRATPFGQEASSNYFISVANLALNWPGSEYVYWTDILGKILDFKDSVLTCFHKNDDNDFNWTDRIKSVERTVSIFEKVDGEKKWIPETAPLQLFLPSVCSYFSAQDLQNIDEWKTALENNEDTQFDYYKGCEPAEMNPKLVKYDMSNIVSQPYWLCTSQTNETSAAMGAAAITNYGIVSSVYAASEANYGVAPCFCL